MNDIQAKSVLIVRKNKVERLFDEQILIEEVGAKAFGLSKIPAAWTLPFFVISTEMYEMYTSGIDISDIKKAWNENIITAMEQMKFDFDQNIYLRSNMCEEGLEKRGQFESYDCSIENLFETIKIYFDSFKDIDVSQIKIPLLIQQYSQALGKGHISNEKRLSKEHRDWKGEIEGLHKNSTANIFEKIFKIPLRNWRQSVDINDAIYRPLRCSSLDNIKQVLIYPCWWWATIRQDRIHFEWIFDGMYIYIVQADVEKDYGINPMTLYKNSYHLEPHTFTPQILHRLSSKDRDKYSSYSKVCNPLLYIELGFKIAPLYILDDQQEIQRLINQEISEYLKNDIQALLTTPLVIRTDIDMIDISAKQMLPRTDGVCNTEDAIDWLKCKSKKLYDEGHKKFIFIIHNFIPAFTSAFAYAKPNTRCVLMESLWGVPEGLYYYTHDKYIVDTMNNDFSKVTSSKITIVEKDINAKTNFIFPNINGEWKYNSVSVNYIWRPAIPKKKWVQDIALNTRKIAERMGKGVSVMWFIGVNPKEYGCNVLPWYHEKFEYNSAATQRNRKKYLGELVYKIHKNSDIEKLKLLAKNGNNENIKYILFQPIEENMIRNKEIIKEIGELAKELGAVISLDGGVLSHAYYQLKRTGAAIEVNNPFKKKVSTVEHNKLVRDKIPDKIESSGEVALTKKLSDNELFEQLRLKLIEEAFEVLDANDTDELIQELADVLEVIDSIIEKQKINMTAINSAKAKKKEKVGGFNEGIILQQTELPVDKSFDKANSQIHSYKKDVVSSWIDKNEKPGYKKVFQRLKIPVYLKQWKTYFKSKEIKEWSDTYIVLKSKRINSTLNIEIAIEDSKDNEQFLLFDN